MRVEGNEMSDFKDYCCSYRYDQAEWSLVIRAKSFEDATRRLKTIGAWGTVDGELVTTIPGYVPRFLVDAVVAIRNLFK